MLAGVASLLASVSPWRTPLLLPHRPWAHQLVSVPPLRLDVSLAASWQRMVPRPRTLPVLHRPLSPLRVSSSHPPRALRVPQRCRRTLHSLHPTEMAELRWRRHFPPRPLPPRLAEASDEEETCQVLQHPGRLPLGSLRSPASACSPPPAYPLQHRQRQQQQGGGEALLMQMQRELPDQSLERQQDPGGTVSFPGGVTGRTQARLRGSCCCVWSSTKPV
mmetsp:Transcript_7758/g.15089  ORF Transcript_7758/g.15089 Transcript_7758/m.15089 type:complete len:219 (+) Transcript_7758:211-867(+)